METSSPELDEEFATEGQKSINYIDGQSSTFYIDFHSDANGYGIILIGLTEYAWQEASQKQSH